MKTRQLSGSHNVIMWKYHLNPLTFITFYAQIQQNYTSGGLRETVRVYVWFLRRKYRVNIPASALWQEDWVWLILVGRDDAFGNQIMGLFWGIQKLCSCSLVESHSSDQKWISLCENWNGLCDRNYISAFFCSLPPLAVSAELGCIGQHKAVRPVWLSPLGRQGRRQELHPWRHH